LPKFDKQNQIIRDKDGEIWCGRESINDRRMIMRDSQAEKADRFQALHARPGCVRVPNPWNAEFAEQLSDTKQPGHCARRLAFPGTASRAVAS
jgi:hypothetical protein